MTSPLRTNYYDGGVTPAPNNLTATDLNAMSAVGNASKKYLGPVSSQTQMNTLTGNVGDYCYRADLGMFYFLMPTGAGGAGWAGVTVPIPASQLSSAVQTNLNLASTAQQASLTTLDDRYLSVPGPGIQGWGGWTHDLAACAATGAIPTAGLVYVSLLELSKPHTITNLIRGVITAGAGLTAGQNFDGLFQNSVLLASTADMSTAWQSTGLHSAALSSPQTVDPANGPVYAGCFSNGTTRPAFAQATVASSLALLLPPFVRYGYDSSHTGRTTSLPATLGTLNSTTALFAAWS